MQHVQKVETYYQRNTNKFLKWGADDHTHNIHAALWPEGVQDLKAAMNYSNQLILEEIRTLSKEPSKVLDLGCGVGSSLIYLGNRLPATTQLEGVTLSQLQVELARKKVQQAGQGKYRFFQGDFMEISQLTDKITVAYAIEAFGHSKDPVQFFREVGSVMQYGGLLLIIDDFLMRTSQSRKEDRLLKTYQRHWLLPSLCSVQQMERMGADVGLSLVKKMDLTPWLRLRRPRDQFISVLVKVLGPLLNRSYYGRMLKGGDAKQFCYLEGLTKYGMLVFEKTKIY